jgi:hypothetical protein
MWVRDQDDYEAFDGARQVAVKLISLKLVQVGLGLTLVTLACASAAVARSLSFTQAKGAIVQKLLNGGAYENDSPVRVLVGQIPFRSAVTKCRHVIPDYYGMGRRARKHRLLGVACTSVAVYDSTVPVPLAGATLTCLYDAGAWFKTPSSRSIDTLVTGGGCGD